MSTNSNVLCRYFANNCCRMGDRCIYSHDGSSRANMTCRYYLQGSCGYGSSCRYDHVRPKKEKPVKVNSTKSAAPKPVFLPKAGLNIAAEEFVPSWKKLEPGASYACAAGATEGSVESKLPLCPYAEVGACEAPDCRFLHGLICEYCNKACLHPHNEAQRNMHIKDCMDEHEAAMEGAFAEARSADKECGICMEKIYDKGLRFGILNGCRHCFCLECIRNWRKNNEQNFESNVVRSCPECRQHSDYVIPSVLWVEDEEEKKMLIQIYKENTGQKLCKYYLNKTSDAGCPFGNKCFYKHQMPDGTIDPGESPHTRRRPQLCDFLAGLDSDDDDDDFDDIVSGLSSRLNELFRRLH